MSNMFPLKLIRLSRFAKKCLLHLEPTQKCYAHYAVASAALKSSNCATSGIKEVPNGIEIMVPHGAVDKPMFLDYMWLLNHCRCSKCFNWKSLQKIGDPRVFVEDVKPVQANVHDQELHLTWSDSHRSAFTFEFLRKYANNNFEIKPEIKRKPWNATLSPDEFPRVDYHEHVDENQFTRQILNHILVTGFCFINNVNATFKDTQRVIEKISTIQKSYLGDDMWDLVVVDDFQDTAYTNEGLPPHVDATYLTDPFGLIMLHCIKEASTGGDSFLIDGLQVAEQLKRTHPEHYEFLSKTPVESTYVDNTKGLYYKLSDTIIKHDPVTKDFEQMRYNFTDISPISNISQHEVRKFYKAYGTLSKAIYDPSNQINFRLTPGTVLLFDNWRLVHGRTPFLGNRLLCGCFIGRSDFLSRSRVLGLLRKDFEVKPEKELQ